MENQIDSVVAVSSVVSAKTPLEPSYVWVTPLIGGECLEHNSNVKDVINFETFCSDYIQQADSPERIEDFRAGEIVCAIYKRRWVRAEILSVADQVLRVFLLDYGGVLKCPTSNCRSIPDAINISIPKVNLATRILLHVGPLTEIEISILTDPGLRISLDRFHVDNKFSNFQLIFKPDMEIFKSKLRYDCRNSSWEVSYHDFINECKENGSEMLQDHELRIKSLKRKLAEVKVRSSTRDQNKSLKENGSFNDSINEVKEKLGKLKVSKLNGYLLERPDGKEKMELENNQELNPRIIGSSPRQDQPSPLINELVPKVKLKSAVGCNVLKVNGLNNEDVETQFERENPPRQSGGTDTELLHRENTTMNVEEKESDNDILGYDSENSKGESSTDNVQAVKRSLEVNEKLFVNIERVRKQDERLSNPNLLPTLIYHTPPNSRPTKLCTKVSESHWSERMKTFLSNVNVTTATSIQSIMWPAISRLSSVAAVAAPGHGKSLGWIIPLLMSLSDKQQYEGLSPGHSPLCIVLCSGVKTSVKVHDSLCSVSSGAGLNVTSLLSCHGTSAPHVTDFINGVDILVSTPLRLLKLVNDDQMISLDRCCHIVIEDGDVILTKWQREIAEVMMMWKRSKQKQSALDQIIVVSDKWTVGLESFTKIFLKSPFRPMVAISNLLEGVVYGNITIIPTFYEVGKDDLSIATFSKEAKIQSILEENRGMKRTIICCSKFKDSRRIHQVLALMGVESILINTDVILADMKQLLDAWNQNPKMPLIVTDDMLTLVAFTGSDRGINLVHWDMPAQSKTNFALRFSFIRSCFTNIFSGDQSQNATVHLLLTINDASSFATLALFLKRCRSEIPEALQRFEQSYLNSKAKRSLSTGALICTDLLTFGHCDHAKTGKCQLRHVLHKDIDTPQVRVSQVVKFRILSVETPVMYWVRLQDLQMEKSHNKMMLSMARYYTNEKTRIPLDTLEVNMLIAAAGDDGVYKRARVVALVYHRKEETEKLVGVEVFLIDCGLKEEMKLEDVTGLPSQFGLDIYPAGAVRVVVSGLVPGDGDTDWGSQVMMYLLAKLDLGTNKEGDMICRGKVLLHLSEVILLDRCEVRVLKPVLRCYVCKVEVAQLLLDEGFGMKNQTAVSVMTEMAAKASITNYHNEAIGIDTNDDSIEEAESGHLAKTAELGEFTCHVYMSECYSPDHFYLNLVSEAENLHSLEEEMQLWVDSEPRSYSINIEKDDYVIVMSADAACQRGQVTSVKTLNETNRFGDLVIQKSYTVFLLDIGCREVTNGANICKCPEDFITKHPFQAIHCRLGQVQPNSGMWSRESGDRLFEMTRTREDQPSVLECTALTTVNGVSVVQLRSGVNLAEDLVLQAHGVWETESLSRTPEESSLMEAPNGVDFDVLDIEKLRAITKHDLGAYLDENLNMEDKALIAESKVLKTDDLTQANVPILPCPREDLDIPSLSVVDTQGMKSRLPNILWRQTRKYISIEIKVFSSMELNPNEVHIKVCKDSMKVEVIELYSCDQSSEIRLHMTPVMQFHNNVVPGSTQVSVLGSVISVKIIKEKQGSWSQLCSQKFNWVKLDPDCVIEETDAKVEDNKVKDFVASQSCKSVSEREVEYECNLDETDPGTTDSESCGENEIEDLLL